MNPSIRKKITSFAIISTLFCGTAIPTLADGVTATTPVVAPKATEVIAGIVPVGSVAINKKSKFELKEVAILAGDQDKTVTFTVTVNNGEDVELQFIDYWVRLTNATGAKYTINLMPEDKDKNRIAPHSSLDFHFYAKVNSLTELKDLKFSFIKWDFSLSDYESKLGEIVVPAAYTDLTPVNVKRLIPLLGTSLKTSVSRVAVNKTEENYLVTVFYTLENIGLKSIKLPVLAFDLQTAEGYAYPLDAKALLDLTLAPRVKKEVQLTTTIPLGVAEKGWKLQLTKEDATVKTLPVALYALPLSSTTAGGSPESTRVIDVAGTSVNTTITRASMGKTETSYLSNIFFSFENNGAKAVVLPEYLFNVKTKDGLIYPLTATGFTKVNLNPKESKEFQLSVSIPITVNVDDLELQLVQPAAEGKDSSFNYPIATYKVPASTTQEVSLGAEYPYKNTSGSYGAQLISIQRLPWEDQDILSAEITIANKGAVAAPPTKLQGYYLLDGKIKIEANLLDMDKVVTIPVNGKMSYVLMGKIPYTTQFTDLKLVLEEKPEKDIVAKTLAEFTGNSDLMALPMIEKGKSYKLLNTGKSAELSITNLYTYKGANDDLYYMELDLKSLEKRITTATPLSAYLKTKDDLYFPATVANATGKINPGGKALLSVTAVLPQGMKGADLDLMIGQSVNSVPSAAPGENEGSVSTDGYIRVAKMVLPDENTTVKSSLDGLVLLPYTVGLSNFKVESAPEYYKGFDINFDYKLAKSTNTASDPKTNVHKLVIEITDGSSNIHSITYPLDVAAGSEAKGLKVGTGTLKVPIAFTSEEKGIEFANSIGSSNSYSIKVYDEYKDGYRRLLGTSNGTWFPTY